MALTFYAICSFALAISYLILIFIYIHHWQKSPILQVPENFKPTASLSIIIPIRNEAEHIVDLLKSILGNNYPEDLLEIIVIDDHSTDGSAEKVEQLNASHITILSLEEHKLPTGFNSYKKYGISKAIDIAQGDFIITTDGDCIVPNKWLSYFAYSFEVKQKLFVAAPVNFIPSDNMLVSFQALDFMGMMLVTGANITRNKSLLCNGANLGYAKKLFTEVGGYEGISEQASGDDVMLMNKIAAKNKKDIFFIKNREATVKTKAVSNWTAFVQQRLRWGTKNSNSNDLFLKFELGIVYLLCINLLLLPFVILANGSYWIAIFLGVLFIKMLADFIFLRKASHFFGAEKQMRKFIPSFFIYVVYIAYVGTLSLFKKKYVWKGREVQ